MSIGRLVERLFSESEIVKVERLLGGMAAESTAVILTPPHPNILVRQLKPHKHATAAQEYRILQLVHTAGVAAPEPLFLDETGDWLGAPSLVMTLLDGVPDYDPVDRVAVARQTAVQLAKLHQMDVSALDLSFLPRGETAVSYLIQNPQQPPDRRWYEQQVQATLQACWPFSRRNADTLLHGDFWPGNLLWRDGQLVGIVDWEDAAIGSPLLDFAIAQLDTLMIYGEAAFNAFTAQYQAANQLDFTNLPLWQLAAALRLGRMIEACASGWAELGRPDITEGTVVNAIHTLAEGAFAKL